jgi:hypothetical protein
MDVTEPGPMGRVVQNIPVWNDCAMSQGNGVLFTRCKCGKAEPPQEFWHILTECGGAAGYLRFQTRILKDVASLFSSTFPNLSLSEHCLFDV